MNKNIKILCTIGPKSLNEGTISFFLKNKVDIFRLNMSHTSLKNLESNIKFLQNCGVKNICVDSEGAQIRTANINKSRFLKKEQKIIFSNDESKKFYFQLYPYFDFNKIKINTFFKVGFDGLEFKVINKSNKLLKAKVVQAGKIENNKGVHFN